MAVTEEHLATEKKRLTEAEFMALPDDGQKHELVDGEVTNVPTGGLHGEITMGLALLLGPVVRKIGKAYDSSTGFRMASGNIRSPDFSYMQRERLPEGKTPVGFIDGAPDLAVEVISPSEDKEEMARKVVEYLDSGARQVWQVFPESQRVVVYKSLDDVQTFRADEDLDGGDLLPGFRCKVADLFATE